MIKINTTSKLFCFIIFISLIGIHDVSSQERTTLTGRITSSFDNTPIDNAQIFIRNVNNGTISAFDGQYILSGIKKGDVIEVSKLGYKKMSYTVENKKKNQKWDVSLSEDILSLSEVVITNFGNKKDEEKLQSSVAVSTLSSKEIEERAPRTSIDILKSMPGFWVESSGGQGPASVWVRGFPQSGGYAFLGLMEDGLPLFQVGYLALGDQFYKIDETLDKVEAIRGGSAPILMQGASGAVINHISKTGGYLFTGDAKVAYGIEQGSGRIDLNLGGPISNTTTYNVGGFYRSGTGIYDYGYQANRGGQIRANVLQKFNDSKIKLKYNLKFLNDNVNWNMPSPYRYNKNGDLDEVGGFDLKTDGFGTNNEDTEFSYILPSGEEQNIDLKDGFFTRIFSAGLEADFKLNQSWLLTNKFRIDNITHNNFTDVINEIEEFNETDVFVYSDGTPITDPTNHNGNGLYTQSFLVGVENDYDVFVDRLELSNNTDKNLLTVGGELFLLNLDLYSSTAIVNKELKNAPRQIFNALQPLPASAAYFSPAGINRRGGKETTFSFYVNDKWDISKKLRLDSGFRLDNKSIDGYNFKNAGLPIVTPDGIPIPGGTGYVITDDKLEFEDSRTSFSGTMGLNYKVGDDSALYLRGAIAGGAIKLGDYDNIADIENVKNIDGNRVFQSELGYKYRGEKIGVFSSLIYATLDNALTPIVLSNLVFQDVFISTRTISTEIEAQYKPTNNLLFRAVSTIQSSQYTNFNFDVPDGVPSPQPSYDWAGNQAERVPSILNSLFASYKHTRFTVSGDLRYYGSRWSSPANNVKLKAYSEFNLGLKYIFTKNLNLSMQASNLFNTLALVEGDSSGDLFVNPDLIDGKVRLGRRNLPRLVLFRLAYSFAK